MLYTLLISGLLFAAELKKPVAIIEQFTGEVSLQRHDARPRPIEKKNPYQYLHEDDQIIVTAKSTVRVTFFDGVKTQQLGEGNFRVGKKECLAEQAEAKIQQIQEPTYQLTSVQNGLKRLQNRGAGVIVRGFRVQGMGAYPDPKTLTYQPNLTPAPMADPMTPDSAHLPTPPRTSPNKSNPPEPESHPKFPLSRNEVPSFSEFPQVSPIFGESVGDLKPKLVWQAEKNVKLYQVEIILEESQVPLWRAETKETSLPFPSVFPALVKGKSYYWRVDAIQTVDNRQIKKRLVWSKFTVGEKLSRQEGLAYEKLKRSQRPFDLLLCIECYDELAMYTPALAVCERLTKLAPTDPEAWLLLAEYYAKAGRAGDAQTAYKVALNQGYQPLRPLGEILRFLPLCLVSKLFRETARVS